jgi:hypothetical protein
VIVGGVNVAAASLVDLSWFGGSWFGGRWRPGYELLGQVGDCDASPVDLRRACAFDRFWNLYLRQARGFEVAEMKPGIRVLPGTAGWTRTTDLLIHSLTACHLLCFPEFPAAS